MQSQIQDFLLAFSIKWPELMKDVQAQMMPLMECHIRERLKCPSLTIANKLFVHSRRIIGVPDNQFTNEATRLFNMDQKLERMYEELNEPVADVAEARQSMRVSYQHTIENIRQQMQAASQAAPPTGYPNQEFSAQPLINNSNSKAPNTHLSINLKLNFSLNINLNINLSFKHVHPEGDKFKIKYNLSTIPKQIFQSLLSKPFNRSLSHDFSHPPSNSPNSKSISSSKFFLGSKTLSKSPCFNLVHQPRANPFCPDQVSLTNLHHLVYNTQR
ncbi:hypothetical protein TASIC1_0006061100 [Trichoderma asperellum]|uniref:Uncharacterized protein n=1 Tax=Trichoderma asperellum TaxID=101201 RepID=A0A6V8QUW9_TRIAP|nr:hypothetical protein TASIC1_0006061100 [Trichoderma asperellum]